MMSSKFPHLRLPIVALACAMLAGCSGQSDDYAGKPGTAPAAASNEAAPPGETVAPARAIVADGAQFADTGLSPEAILAMPVAATCSLENLVSMTDGQPSPGDAPNSYLARRGNAYKMIGFAINSQAGSVPENVRIVLLGSAAWGVQARTGFERPDVADYFKVPAFASAGYQADAAFDDMPPGEYGVYVIGTEGTTEVACPSHQVVIVE